MRITTVLAAATLSLPMLLTGAHTAADAATADRAGYHRPQVAFVGHARAHHGRARVLAVYRCWGGNRGTHLWVSLKQGGGIEGKTAKELSQMEGTSQIARAWYDTNPVSPRQVTINCDGTWQV